MDELKGRVGIVTGASSGIGYAIANTLAAAGATVYVISRTGKVKDDMEPSLPGVIHYKGDVTDYVAMEKQIAELAAMNDGHLDFLVNNAGATAKCRAEDFKDEDFDRIIEVNVKSVFKLSCLCYPYLKKSPYKGRIINISSMSAHLGFTQVVPYCTSKAAVCGMTRGLAVEWAEDNICVNSIAPGWFASKMLADVMDPARKAKILGRMPVHDFGDTKDLGALALFLIGEHATYITGQDYALDGGALAYGY
ncbi:MAG: SDR family NAD(P)-dependent oxidoreductase [Lachnospiraceae bacterium]|nr:SDR family NAD(P)-dependent oxidoreductase [Lachnospiraceae bacterium]